MRAQTKARQTMSEARDELYLDRLSEARDEERFERETYESTMSCEACWYRQEVTHEQSSDEPLEDLSCVACASDRLDYV